MSDYIVQSESLTTVANKIREKTGESAPLEFPDEFIFEIGKMKYAPKTPTDALLFYSPYMFSMGVFNKTKNWTGSIEYSTDYQTWTEWDGTTDMNAQLNHDYYCIYLRGFNNTIISGITGWTNKKFVFQGIMIKVVGNLYNLIDYTKTLTLTLGEGCCSALFHQSNNVDASDLEIPANIMAKNCFANMFNQCTGTLKAPALPATELMENCYYAMFSQCSSLIEAPELPATILAKNCYYQMFYGTPITKAPDLHAPALAYGSYSRMFDSCQYLTKAPKLSFVSTDTTSCSGMFKDCKMLEELPELLAVNLSASCYNGMFQGCSKIKISATQIDEYQTEYRIPFSGTGTAQSDSLTNMFASTGGTFTSNPTINTTYYTSNTVVPST